MVGLRVVRERNVCDEVQWAENHCRSAVQRLMAF